MCLRTRTRRRRSPVLGLVSGSDRREYQVAATANRTYELAVDARKAVLCVNMATVNLFKPSEWHWPTDFRKFMAWVFAVTSLEYSVSFARSLPNAIKYHYALSLLERLLYAPTFPATVAIICGVAWWTGWKGKRWARGWGIAASLMWILIFLRQFVIRLQSVPGRHVGALFIGSVGLAAFLWYGKERIPTGKTPFDRFYERNAPGDLFKH